MQLKDWQYIAPHRIREGALAIPQARTWPEIRALNLQRLARVLEFQGCIAFVGSGASADLRYPNWTDLIPDLTILEDERLTVEYRALAGLVKKSVIGVSQGLQIAQELVGREKLLDGIRTRFKQAAEYNRDIQAETHSADPDELQRHQRGYDLKKTPQQVLMEFPISRFITTNYDDEVEAALDKLRPDLNNDVGRRAFSQDDLSRLAIFAIALAPGSRNLVFHCHGSFSGASAKPVQIKPESQSTKHDGIVLTDADYNYWYLSNEPVPYTFQRSLEVLLHSNPLFFIGYSLSDPDILRLIRQLSIRRGPAGIASNVFVLLNISKHSRHRSRAQQIRSGINVIPFNNRQQKLSLALQGLRFKYQEIRKRWRLQPCCRDTANTRGGLMKGHEHGDQLYDPLHLMRDATLRHIDSLLKHQDKHVVAIAGPAGSAKFIKVSQFLHSSYARSYIRVVVNSQSNEDLFSYLKRLIETVESQTRITHPHGTLESRLTAILTADYGKCPLLLVLSSIDLFLDIDVNAAHKTANVDEPSAYVDVSADGRRRLEAHGWEPRNTAARALLKSLEDWSKSESNNRVLMTARVLPDELRRFAHVVELVRSDTTAPVFSSEQLGLSDNEHRQLTWYLQDQQAALIIASSYIKDYGQTTQRAPDDASRLERVSQALMSHVSERGTRVVRHVVRELDRDTGLHGFFEKLLTRLSCFNIPVPETVVEQCTSLPGDTKAGRSAPDWKVLLKLRLLDPIAPIERDNEQPEKTLYIVPSVVKRYCRTILAGSHYSERRACGVHGLLSRGPFNNPGTDKTAKKLFEHFSTQAFEQIKSLLENYTDNQRQQPSEDIRETTLTARWFTRAALDILRSNFAANSVSTWGTYREYIDMCTVCIDNIKNLARVLGAMWSPVEGGRNRSSALGTASAEEIIFLYNELGLAYYNEGSVQDALSVWGLAVEWQKALLGDEPEQSVMYSASLHSHIAMAHLQMGRMDAARDSITTAWVAAKANRNRDLELRLEGLLARVDHFRGSLPQAQAAYERVVRELGEVGNRRAQAYFMRHLAALLLRLKKDVQAEELARSSMAIAASNNSFDSVAFARELLGKIFRIRGDTREAIRAYRTAMDEARRLGISRLQADIFLGVAGVQLSIGDAGTARDHAIHALKLANENLLVLRQIKALSIIGKAVAERGNQELATCYLGQAKALARDSQYRLAEHDIDETIAALKAR